MAQPLREVSGVGDTGQLPIELLEAVFRWVDGRHLLSAVARVCKLWNGILDPGSTFWEHYCGAHGQLLLPAAAGGGAGLGAGAPPPYWAKLAINRPLRRDLVDSPTVAQLDGSWTFQPGVTDAWDHGHGWAREPRTAVTPCPCLAASHYPCHLIRRFDIAKMGVPRGTWVSMVISIEMSTRGDCGGKAKVTCALLGLDAPGDGDEDADPDANRCAYGRDLTHNHISPVADADLAGALPVGSWDIASGTAWETHTIRTLPMLVGEVLDLNLSPGGQVTTGPDGAVGFELRITGQDDRFWAGHYGAKVRKVGVAVFPNDGTRTPATREVD